MSWLSNLFSDTLPVPFSTPERGRSFVLPLALVSALLAALLLPRQSPFPYRYETGHPWQYAALQAPFDFEVLHPETAVRADIERIEAEHGPYFLQNMELARRQKRRFSEAVEEQSKVSRHDPQFDDLVANPGAYVNFGNELLEKIYSAGIVSPESEDFRADDPALPVFVVNGAQERRIAFGKLLTVARARELLTDSLPFSSLRQPEMLLPILEKVLIPNVFYSDSLTQAAKQRKIAEVRSTGLTVRKGETLIERNALVTPEVAQKLDSLQQRYEKPGGLSVLLGYFLLSLLAFGGFFYWLRQNDPAVTGQRNALLALPATVLGLILLVSFAQQFEAAAPLLIPLAGLPLWLNRWYSLTVSHLVWAICTSLCALALDWGAGWLAIQVSGAAAAFFFVKNASTLPQRLTGGGLMAAGVFVAWLGAGLAGRLPAALQSTDVALFLLLSVLLSVLLAANGNAGKR